MAAVTATAVADQGGTGTVRAWDLTVAADGDITATITHGLPFADATEADRRMIVILEPIDAVRFPLSKWVVTTRGATTCVLTKTNAVGSGGGTAQVRVHIKMKNRGE
jgi:hypothetical protein